MLIERATTHLLSWPSALAYESQLSRTYNARFNEKKPHFFQSSYCLYNQLISGFGFFS
jgi:hypothetical protein